MGERAINLRPNIFSYHEFRLFLRDWFDYLKETGGRSLRSVARDAGISPAYLPMVFSGKRKLSKRASQRLLPHLGLEPREQAYFNLLCGIEQAESSERASGYYKQVQRFQSYQNENPREAEVFRYMGNWLHVVIREMVALQEFQLDAKWIRRRIAYPVPIREIKRAIEFLASHGFIAVDESGRCSLKHKDIECLGSIFRLALSDYHRQMFSKVASAIDSFPSHQRNVTGITVPLSAAGFEKAKEVLNAALEQLKVIAAAEGSPQVVYHMGLMAIPMTDPTLDVSQNSDKDEGAL